MAARRSWAAAVLAAAVSVSLVACGDDSGSTSSTVAATTSVASGSATTAKPASGSATTAKPAAGSATTAAAGSATTAKPAAGGGSSGGSSAAQAASDVVAAVNAVAKGDCAKADRLLSAIDDASEITNGGDWFEEFASAFDKLASSGPSEVRADFAVVAKALSATAKELAAIDLSDPDKAAEALGDPKTADAIEAVQKALSDSEVVDAAFDRIDVWVGKKCPGLGAPATTKA
jgi:hypothetical protein